MKMKRSLMLIIAVFAVTPIFPFNAFAEESATEIKLIYKKTNPTKIHRSPDFAEVEAWYDSGSMTVTVEGCELKDTFIYIMSPDGLIFAQTSCYFGITPGTCTIDAPSLSGKYWLVIDSPTLYAEGAFLIN